MGAGDEVTEGIVGVGVGVSRGVHADEPVHGVVGVGRRPCRARGDGQVAVLVVTVTVAADGGVLVEVIRGVGGGHAVLGHRGAISHRVVTIGDGLTARQRHRGELAVGVVAVCRRPLEGRHGRDTAEDIVGVSEL